MPLEPFLRRLRERDLLGSAFDLFKVGIIVKKLIESMTGSEKK